MSLQSVMPIERKIIRAILDTAAARGWLVSVYDGEEWALVASDSRPAIWAAMATTDADTLRFRKPGFGPDGKPESVGSMFLVYGNGEDLISDYSDNSEMAELASAAALACEGVL